MFRAISCGATGIIAIGSLLLPLAISQVTSGTPTARVKGDRLDVLESTTCVWPHYDVSCLYEGAGRTGEVHKVRIIITGRITGRSWTLDERHAPDLQRRHSAKDRDHCASLPPSCGSSQGIGVGEAIGVQRTWPLPG